jgi:hypothetical protein
VDAGLGVAIGLDFSHVFFSDVLNQFDIGVKDGRVFEFGELLVYL